MFAKARQYFYDQDPLRVSLISPHGNVRSRDKPGLMRWDGDGNIRSIGNPIGRNAGSVWRINSANHKGPHPATFPPELVRRMIVSSCDDNSLVLDVFGGAGTTAMVALQLGHRAITIDLNQDYTEEARARLADAPATEVCGNGEPVSGRASSAASAESNIIDLAAALRKSMRPDATPRKAAPQPYTQAKLKRAADQAAKPGRKRA